MLKYTKDMTDDELIKEMKSEYPPNDHNIWRFERITGELKARGYVIEEYYRIEAEKKELMK